MSNGIEVVLLDFGGVIASLGTDSVSAELEEALGLENGQLRSMMYSCVQWDAVASGQMLEREYFESLASRLRRDPEVVRQMLVPVWDPQGLNEGVVALARSLRPHVRVAILSNWTESLERHIESLGIGDLFDPVINSARVGVRKPDEAIFRHTLEALGVPPEKVLFVDDSQWNVEAAQAMGMEAVLFESVEGLEADLRDFGLLPVEFSDGTGNRWGPEAPPEDRPLDLVVYRSRLIGADTNLVVWGGGNTSVKTVERDHLGRERTVMRIKGSGTDLKSIEASGFPGVFLDEVMPLLERESMSDAEMVAYLEHCMVEPSGRRPSIETLLHGFLSARHVDHTHADAVIALTNTAHGREAVREALGDRVAYIPWRRPGFLLSKEVWAAAPHHDAIVLANHGLVTWGDTAEESYRTTVEMTRRAERYLQEQSRQRGDMPRHATTSPDNLAELLLRLRGRLGHVILQRFSAPPYRALADRHDIADLAAAGPATADHVLRTRTWSVVLKDSDPVSVIDEYEERYRAFFARHAWPGLQMLDPRPRVFLIPGFGMVTWGKDAREAGVVAEVALHTLQVAARGKDAHGSYRSFNETDLFDVDYWPLELYKLTLAPKPRELQGRVVLVTGAASGIGRAVAEHLAELGAQMVLLDLNARGLVQTTADIAAAGHARPLPLPVNLTDANAVELAIRRAVDRFGGIDALVSNAGIAAIGTLVALTPEEWRRSMEVNATSHFLVTREVLKIMDTQGLGGSIVYIASKNAFSPGAGFGAYSAAKAAEVQLARITALEGGPIGVRANIINPDAVFEGSRFWSDEARAERAEAHGVPVEELEAFYAKRNLLKARVTGLDVAEAAAFLISDRSRTTTGTVITVDGGVASAFPR